MVMLIRRLLRPLGDTYDSKTAIVQHAFVDLAFRRLRLGHTPTANEIEHTMHVIDAGQLDAMMEDAMPPLQPPEPERYANVKPFDHEAWKARHVSK